MERGYEESKTADTAGVNAYAGTVLKDAYSKYGRKEGCPEGHS